MATAPKKSNNAPSFSQVSSLAQFIAWATKIKEQDMLFRGLGNIEWNVESSLYRQLKNIENDMILERTKELIKSTRMSGYNIKNGPILNDLDDLQLLANLQHIGNPTCLIDFTENPLIALFFACQLPNIRTGKVVAFSSNDTNLYNNITKNTNKDISYWFTEYERNKKLCIFSPLKITNRITAQQSVLVFGSPTLSAKNFHICEITNKEEILEELKKIGTSRETLFVDDVGFYVQSSYSKKDENEYTDSNFAFGKISQASGDFESAIKYYNNAIKFNPKFYEAYNSRGIVKQILGNYQSAISDYNEAIMLNSTYYEAYNNRGIAKGDLGKFQNAISDYDEAIMLNPKYYEAYNNRGFAKYNLDEFQDAISDYDEAIMLNPKYSGSYNNRGLAKNKLRKFQNAISDFNESIRLNPKYWGAYHNRGIAKQTLGKFQDAISDYDEAIRLNPKDCEAYNNRGFAKYNLGEFQDAISDFDEAIRLNPKYSIAYNNRGIAKHNLGKFQDAISDYDEAIRLNLKYSLVYNNRGLAKRNLGDEKGAAADFAKAAEIKNKE